MGKRPSPFFTGLSELPLPLPLPLLLPDEPPPLFFLLERDPRTPPTTAPTITRMATGMPILSQFLFGRAAPPEPTYPVDLL